MTTGQYIIDDFLAPLIKLAAEIDQIKDNRQQLPVNTK